MRSRLSSQTFLILLSFLLGVMVVMQIRTQSRAIAALSARSPVDQTRVIGYLVETNAALRQQGDALEKQLAQLQQTSPQGELEALVEQINQLKMFNGLVEVSGPGVEVWIWGEITATDASDLINELWQAGAEGITLNDQRLVVRSVVARAEEGLVVNDTRLRSPYVLRAVGDVENLSSVLEQRGSYLSLLRLSYPNLVVTVTKAQRVVLPLYQGELRFRYAREVKPAGA